LETRAPGRELVDLRVQVLRHKAYIERFAAFTICGSTWKKAGMRVKCPSKSLVNVVSDDTPTRMEPWRWTNVFMCSVIVLVFREIRFG